MSSVAGKAAHDRDARRAALIVFACSISVDVVLTSIGFSTGRMVRGTTPILEMWDLLKALLLASTLLFASWRARSRGLGLFALIFLMIGVADLALAHDRIAEWLVDRIDLGGIGALLPGNSATWVELLILTVLAFLAAVSIRAVKDSWEGYPSVRNTLVGLLGVLIIFAVGVDFVASSASSTRALAIIEESGERFAMSLTLAYASGVARSVGNAS
jgi:hypothetical protein